MNKGWGEGSSGVAVKRESSRSPMRSLTAAGRNTVLLWPPSKSREVGWGTPQGRVWKRADVVPVRFVVMLYLMLLLGEIRVAAAHGPGACLPAVRRAAARRVQLSAREREHMARTNDGALITIMAGVGNIMSACGIVPGSSIILLTIATEYSVLRNIISILRNIGWARLVERSHL